MTTSLQLTTIRTSPQFAGLQTNLETNRKQADPKLHFQGATASIEEA
jgi:hypothetical protein